MEITGNNKNWIMKKQVGRGVCDTRFGLWEI